MRYSKSYKFICKLLALPIVCFFMQACKTTSIKKQKSLEQIPSTLLGKFKDDYGSNFNITQNLWQQGIKTKYHLLFYSKEGNYIIAQNDSLNSNDAGLYTRIDIVYFNNMQPWQWGFCLSAYKAASFSEAVNTLVADKNNPRKGCNGYPYTRMKRYE